MSNISFNPLAWAIKPLYDKAIKEDALFAKEVQEKESRKEKPKSLSECAEYILGEAYDWASNHRDGSVGYAGLPDDEMINLIKHYYDEEDITIKKVTGAKAQVAKTGDSKKEEKKPSKPKVERPKETLDCVNVPMVRPTSTRDAKKGSKDQASNVIEMDLWGGLFAEEKEEEKKQEEEIEEEVEEVEVEEMIEEDDDDLPM